MHEGIKEEQIIYDSNRTLEEISIKEDLWLFKGVPEFEKPKVLIKLF